MIEVKMRKKKTNKDIWKKMIFEIDVCDANIFGKN
jgi:hypothetical protein